MKNELTMPTCIMLTLVFFTFSSVFVPATATASWRDRSDELPGMESFPTGLAILTGVVLVGAVTYLIVKKNKKNKAEKEAVEDNAPVDAQQEAETNEAEQTTLLLRDKDDTKVVSSFGTSECQASKIGLYFNVDQGERNILGEKSAPDISDITVKVGVSFVF